MRPRLIKLRTLETIYKENNIQISKISIRENNVFFNILMIFLLIFGCIFLYYRYLTNYEKRIIDEKEKANKDMNNSKERELREIKMKEMEKHRHIGLPPPIVQQKTFKSNDTVKNYEKIMSERNFGNNYQSQLIGQQSDANLMLNDIHKFKSFNKEYI